MKIGSKIKNFKAEMTGNIHFSLSEYQGKNVVIYFYPRDNTPGCTSEGEDFRDNYKFFQKKNTLIFGVSKDSVKSHENFKEKFNFPFELISDPDEKICNIFDVIKEKSMYGKKYMGIERSTFLIDAQGKLIQEWRKVKVKGHAEDVLNSID
ncbi:peroxiredoxin [Gammaproteobacteria bacterium]|nr:peroxiredoxin [Gammaproteobacteria bacterium]